MPAVPVRLPPGDSGNIGGVKALVREIYGPPDVLAVADVDMPSPRQGEALVRVKAASLNTADLDYLYGRPRVARIAGGWFRPRSSRLGLDVAGVVEAVGPGVTEVAVGDEVWADLFSHGQCSLAEYVCVEAGAFTPKPPSSSFEDAAAVPHSGVLAFQGLLSKGPILPGQKALINGGGGCVGPFAIQIAKAFGGTVTGVDTTEKLELMTAAGADQVIDFTRDDLARAGRFDLILDIAQARSVSSWRRMLEPEGRFVLIARTIGGFFRAAVMGGLISLVEGRRMGTFSWHPNRRGDLDTLGDLMGKGRLEPIIDRRFTLDEAPAAIRHLAEGKARGKVLVIP
jgi:NADPH:quinone reductase-like Zn-dependent oxidoreductase